jgi:hypothetical protein
MVQLPVSLVRGQDQQSVEARLLDLEPRHVADFQSLWQAQLRQFSQADKYWDWAFKERLTIRDVNYEGYAVESEGRTQGLMIWRPNGIPHSFIRVKGWSMWLRYRSLRGIGSPFRTRLSSRRSAVLCCLFLGSGVLS